MTMKGNRVGASTPEPLSTKLHRIAETARKQPAFQFRTIAHLITTELLEISFHKLRKDSAAGIDEVTAREYGRSLQANIARLHVRLKDSTYRAQPLRRVYIEKEDGKQRPLSIPVLEDKIAQRAVVTLLNTIYEQDFLPCSYGYRPRRSAQDALDDIQQCITKEKMDYVLEADIRDFFGSIHRGELMRILRKRILDKNLLRLIGKWLRVGVIEEGRLTTSETGTYQGSVISPVLANIYLHDVLDQWVEQTVKPRMQGTVKLYRYADDFIVCFQFRSDAERFKQVLAKRLEKYRLTLHPDKTLLVEFGRMAWWRAKRTGIKPSTFNFLGFTLICGTTRIGKFSVKTKTMAKRIRRARTRVAVWCKRNRHLPIHEQWQHLSAVMRGHYAYYGRQTNSRALRQFYLGVRSTWRRWLNRRTRGRRSMPWRRFGNLLKRYPLPLPRINRNRRQQLSLRGESF